MDIPEPRCCEQHFLNLPGMHAGAYVRAYISATDPDLAADSKRNPHPSMTLELADCSRRINFEFSIESAHERANSFHKIDTLIAALQEFRAGMEIEARQYRRREAQKEHRDREKALAKSEKPQDAKVEDSCHCAWCRPDYW